MINTQSEAIGKKDNEIMILEEKMNSLQVQYKKCVDSNISLSYNLEIERTEKLAETCDENLKLKNDNVNLKKKNGMLDQRLKRANILSCARLLYGN
ncbi:30960_t:CDS:2 [Gigaspora margarita]|uniref:30960_t:CDS:1 n=1 Tax=Gigaspora margarita TaxID=4874 RepID=A0ABN7UFM1_GIGMA|nr:30960_t:CDS:2 [Gigaspora margarita]